MTAFGQLMKEVADHKGQVVAGQFSRYLQGLITKDEFEAVRQTQEHHFEKLLEEMKGVSENCIQSVMIALER